MTKRLTCLLVLFFLFGGIGCSRSNHGPQNEASEGNELMESIEIEILKGDANTLGLGYEYTDAWSIIQANAGDTLLVIEESDIQNYDWLNQTIELTETGINKLSPYIPEVAIRKNAFIMKLGQIAEYGGIINEAYSAARIRFPVIYMAEGENNITLSIKPYHSWKDYSEFPLEDKKRIEIEEIYNRLERIGKLK